MGLCTAGGIAAEICLVATVFVLVVGGRLVVAEEPLGHGLLEGNIVHLQRVEVRVLGGVEVAAVEYAGLKLNTEFNN